MLRKGQTNSGSFKKGQVGLSKGKKLPERSGVNHPKWKGGDVTKLCVVCSTEFKSRPCRVPYRKYCSRKCASIAFKGTPAWNKGTAKISTENELVRKSNQYKLWRESVFKRDNYTCQECHMKGGVLNADHIKPFAIFKDLRFEITNGRTLCVMCHRKTPTWGWSTYHMRKKHEKD